MPAYQIELDDEKLAIIADLARRRGVSANTIIEQAISTEKLLADAEAEGDDLLIKKGNGFQRLRINRSKQTKG